MNQQATTSLERFRLIPRSIRGLMLLTFCAAAVCGFHATVWDASLEIDDLAETALLTISGVILIGLSQQAFCLWRERRRLVANAEARELPSIRFGLSLSAVARVLVAANIIFVGIIRGLRSSFGVDLPDWVYQFNLIWDPLLPIWLVVAVMLARQAQRVPRHRKHWQTIWKSFVSFVGALVVLATFAILLLSAFLVVFLVFIAVRGIELHYGNTRSPLLPELDQNVLARVDPALWLSFLSLLPLALAAWAIWRSKARRAQNGYLVAAVISTLTFTGLLAWNIFGLLPQATPFLIGERSEFSLLEIAANGIPWFCCAAVS